MRISLTRALAKKLGMVAVAGGMTLGMAADGYAASITVGDQGFEDNVHVNAASYSYGSVPGTSGNGTGFSPESGGGSAWTDIGKDGAARGTAGGDASFMYTADYSVGGQADPIGDQAIEIQAMIAQVLGDTFVQGQYTITVAAAPSVNNELRAILFDGTTYADLTSGGPVTAAGILADANTLSGVMTSGAASGGVMEDLTFTLDVGAGSPLIGQAIGIAFDGNGDGTGIGIDNVRLDEAAIPEPGTLVMLGLGSVALAGLARRKK